jgi:hypothetical protein
MGEDGQPDLTEETAKVQDNEARIRTLSILNLMRTDLKSVKPQLVPQLTTEPGLSSLSHLRERELQTRKCGGWKWMGVTILPAAREEWGLLGSSPMGADKSC